MLKNGQIVAEGIIDTSQHDFTVAIIGGTGAYRTSHGELRIHDVADNVTTYTIVLT